LKLFEGRPMKKTRRHHDRRPRRSRYTPRTSTRSRIPRTANELLRKSEQQQDTWTRVTHVVATIRREGVSFAHALRGSGVSRQTVLRLAGSSLRKPPSGRWAARTRDSLLRLVRIPVPDGMRDIALRDSKQASLRGDHQAGRAVAARASAVRLPHALH
jgi:hypothetical protein